MAVLALAALAALAGGAHAVFNYSLCPHPYEFQTDYVQESFTIDGFLNKGAYELAFHDYTQYPVCPKVRVVHVCRITRRYLFCTRV